MTASVPRRGTRDFSLTSVAGPYMTNSIRAFYIILPATLYAPPFDPAAHRAHLSRMRGSPRATPAAHAAPSGDVVGVWIVLSMGTAHQPWSSGWRSITLKVEGPCATTHSTATTSPPSLILLRRSHLLRSGDGPCRHMCGHQGHCRVRQGGAAAAFATQHGHDLLGKQMHLLFNLLCPIPTAFKPRREEKVLVVAGLFDTQDLFDHFFWRAHESDALLYDQVRGNLHVQVVHRLPKV